MPEIECGFAGRPDLLTLYGPTIPVSIGFDPLYRPGARPGVDPDLPGIEHNALVDTGARESCIDSSVAAALDLPIIDRMPVSGVHGTMDVNVHLAQIRIPALGVVTHGRFAGVHLRAGGQPHSALIGRAFLRHMTMRYIGGTGSAILSYPPENAA